MTDDQVETVKRQMEIVISMRALGAREERERIVKLIREFDCPHLPYPEDIISEILEDVKNET